MKKTRLNKSANIGLIMITAFVLAGCGEKIRSLEVTVNNNSVEAYHFWIDDGRCTPANKVEPGADRKLIGSISYQADIGGSEDWAGSYEVFVGQNGAIVYSQRFSVVAPIPYPVQKDLIWNGSMLN